MIPKVNESLVVAQAGLAISLGKCLGSYNECGVNETDSDSESESDSIEYAATHHAGEASHPLVRGLDLAVKQSFSFLGVSPVQQKASA